MKTAFIIVGILLVLLVLKFMAKMAWKIFWLISVIAVAAFVWIKFF
jgi:phosphoglycerol transferase MdoB-like AlkP superfamily enzyme